LTLPFDRSIFSSPPPRFAAPDCNSDHQGIDETTKARMTTYLVVKTWRSSLNVNLRSHPAISRWIQSAKPTQS
jgi:hypothetical protein